MNILDKFFETVGILPAEVLRKASRTWDAVSEAEKFAGKPTRLEDYLSAYTTHIWVYACVYAISSAVAGVPFKIYRKKMVNNFPSLEEVHEGPAFELFEKINPLRTRYDFWEETVAYGELSGNIYWEIVEKDNKPVELYALRPDRIEIIPDPKKLIGGFEYNINGKIIKFSPDEIMQLRYFSPLSELYGQGSLAPANTSVLLDLYAGIFNKNFFKHGARIEGVLETDRSLSPKAFDRLKGMWASEYGGYKKAFKTAVLEEGLKYKGISSTHKDMDFYQQKKLNREEILAAFGVQPAIVGLFEYANYANVKEQKRLFWSQTVIPKLTKIKEYINAFLLPRFEDAQYIGDWDLTQVEALKEDEETQAGIDRSLIEAGINTINERRKARNLPPVPWGDSWWVKGKRPALEITKAEELEIIEGESWRLYKKK